MADEQSREDKLAAMARRFVDRARQQAVRIGELRPVILQEQGKGDALKEMRQLVHSLHGSGGTFGFGDISVAAGVAEDCCDGLLAADDAPAASQLPELDQAIEKLLALIGEIDHPK